MLLFRNLAETKAMYGSSSLYMMLCVRSPSFLFDETSVYAVPKLPKLYRYLLFATYVTSRLVVATRRAQ